MYIGSPMPSLASKYIYIAALVCEHILALSRSDALGRTINIFVLASVNLQGIVRNLIFYCIFFRFVFSSGSNFMVSHFRSKNWQPFSFS